MIAYARLARAESARWAAGALFVLAFAPMLAGCGGTEVQEGNRGGRRAPGSDAQAAREQQARMPSRSLPRAEYYAGALQLMTNEERRKYFAMADDHSRDQYLRRIGVDVRFDLSHALSRGLDKDETLQVLAGEESQGDPLHVGTTEEYTFRRFNGRGYTHLYVQFRDDALTNWGSYIDDPEEERLRRRASEIEVALKKILNVGDSMEHVRNQYALYRDIQRDQERAYNLDDDQYWQDHEARAALMLGQRQVVARELLKNPPKKIEEFGPQVHWIYEQTFGARRVQYRLVFDERRLREFYAEPVPRDASN